MYIYLERPTPRTAPSILGRSKSGQTRNPDPRLSRDDSTGGRWRSLQRPRHRPNGTGLSLAITTTSPVAAPSTRAPDHLAAQHVRVMRTSARVGQRSAGCCGKSHVTTLNRRTHHMVVCAPIALLLRFVARLWSVQAGERPQSVDLMILVDDGGPTATCCHAGRACRARRRRGRWRA